MSLIDLPPPLALSRGTAAYATALVEARQRATASRSSEMYFQKMRAIEEEALRIRYSAPSFHGEERIARAELLAAQRHLEMAAVARGYPIPRYQAMSMARTAEPRHYYVPALPLSTPTSLALTHDRIPGSQYRHYTYDAGAPANRMVAAQRSESAYTTSSRFASPQLPFGTFGRIRGMKFPRDDVRTHKLYRYVECVVCVCVFLWREEEGRALRRPCPRPRPRAPRRRRRRLDGRMRSKCLCVK